MIKIGKVKNQTKKTLTNVQKAIETASNECSKLPCQCDSGNNFICPIHEWKTLLSYLEMHVQGAIEAEGE